MLTLELVPVALLPDQPGILPRHVLGPCSPWGSDGDPQQLWGPDVLPVHSGGAADVLEHPALPEAWQALATLVDTLDGLADAGA